MKASTVSAGFPPEIRAPATLLSVGSETVLAQELDALGDGLRLRGFGTSLVALQGHGGAISARLAPTVATQAIHSRAAAGIIAASYAASAVGFGDVITCDIGGACCDCAVIDSQTPRLAPGLSFGKGLLIPKPTLAVDTVGPGALAAISANSQGQITIAAASEYHTTPVIIGGDSVTLLDLLCVLGHVNPACLNLPGPTGSVSDISQTLARTICGPLGLSSEDTAVHGVRVAAHGLGQAIKTHLHRQKIDLTRFALCAYGAVGPVLIAGIAKELGIKKILIPSRPGMMGALGCLLADLRHDVSDLVNIAPAQLDADTLARILSEQRARAIESLMRERAEFDGVTVQHSAILNIGLDAQSLIIPIDATEPRALREHINAALADIGLETASNLRVLALSTAAIGRRKALSLNALTPTSGHKKTLKDAQIGVRPVRFDTGWVETPIYDRLTMPLGCGFLGPAILEQPDTTVVIEPLDHVASDGNGGLIITRRA